MSDHLRCVNCDEVNFAREGMPECVEACRDEDFSRAAPFGVRTPYGAMVAGPGHIGFSGAATYGAQSSNLGSSRQEFGSSRSKIRRSDCASPNHHSETPPEPHF